MWQGNLFEIITVFTLFNRLQIETIDLWPRLAAPKRAYHFSVKITQLNNSNYHILSEAATFGQNFSLLPMRKYRQGCQLKIYRNHSYLLHDVSAMLG